MGQRPRGPRGGPTGRRGLALGRQLRSSQEGARRRGRGPDPPRSRGGKTQTQPGARRPALPCPARRRAASPSVARWPPPPPPAPRRPQPPRRADESPPPTAGPPLACPPARPPGTRPAPPLAAAHRAEADPAGWLRRHLEQVTKPGPASAAIRLGGGGRQM
ncbi:protein PRRC2A-like [Lagenorhynchus albirostris]|uniref:protein PRRC2A-like n=1 Tax=Lagenorhynchus albirostris TaxID=27610 RepID=UPI0028EE734A|nr:protein PRRC2A-like [Lagenorhynchus albirostris]